MRRRLQVLVGTALAVAAFAGIALAASPPTPVTGGASSIGENSASLHGTVNPNGQGTTYYFQWGRTTAYGAKGPMRSAGSGTTAVSVEETAGNLTPGTTYHYRLVAVNASGTSDGADRTFTTAAAPVVTTGRIVQLSASGATLTGAVNPAGQSTTWYFQWGNLSSLSQQTAPQTLPASNSPQQVAWSLQGLLNPGTVYQYRLVAQHAHSPLTYGTTAIFMTYPSVRPYARVSATTRPRHRLLQPYELTTTGTVGGPYWIPAQFACIGEVTLRFFHRSRQVRFETAPVQSNCTYSATTVFPHLPAGLQPPVRLRVVVHFVSTPFLARSRAPIRYVSLG